MKEAAIKSLSTEAADSAESSARRTARAGARREPCMLSGHSSTKVCLEASERKLMSKRCARVAPPESREDRPSECICRRRMPGMALSWRVRAAPPWIRQRLWWEQVAPPELKAGSPIFYCLSRCYLLFLYFYVSRFLPLWVFTLFVSFEPFILLHFFIFLPFLSRS